MTPLEKALAEPRGNYLTWDDWLKGVITAFLEAAAEDGDLLRAIRVSGAPDGRLGIFEHDIKGIVLALKEAVNAG